MMMSGLSGNEIYCLAQKGWTPGNIVVGNSVYSLGFLGSITSGLRMMAGGEIENITRLISDGRHAAIQRLEQEANEEGAHGLTGVISELKSVSGLTEFLAIGSAITNRSSRRSSSDGRTRTARSGSAGSPPVGAACSRSRDES